MTFNTMREGNGQILRVAPRISEAFLALQTIVLRRPGRPEAPADVQRRAARASEAGLRAQTPPLGLSPQDEHCTIMRWMCKGFPANPAPMPRPRLAGGPRLLRLTGSTHSRRRGRVPGPVWGCRGLPVERSNSTSANSHQDPSQGVLGRPRGGAKLGEPHRRTPALRTPPQGRPLWAHSWAVRPGTSGKGPHVRGS